MGGRKKRAKWMRIVWEEGKKGWMEENGMGRRKKGLDGGNCFINKEERGRIKNEWRKAVQEKKREHNQGERYENYIGKRQKVDRWWSYGDRKAIQDEEGFS